jgi:hypothetical protein
MLQDPPEYYARPGGYLVYSADVPAAMIAAAVPATLAAGEKLQLNGTVAHFELVHHQLKQVRISSTCPRCSKLKYRQGCGHVQRVPRCDSFTCVAAAHRVGDRADAGPRPRVPKDVGGHGQVSLNILTQSPNSRPKPWHALAKCSSSSSSSSSSPAL